MPLRALLAEEMPPLLEEVAAWKKKTGGEPGIRPSVSRPLWQIQSGVHGITRDKTPRIPEINRETTHVLHAGSVPLHRSGCRRPASWMLMCRTSSGMRMCRAESAPRSSLFRTGVPVPGESLTVHHGPTRAVGEYRFPTAGSHPHVRPELRRRVRVHAAGSAMKEISRDGFFESPWWMVSCRCSCMSR